VKCTSLILLVYCTKLSVRYEFDPPSKPLVDTLRKKLYYHCSVLVVCRNQMPTNITEYINIV